MKNCICRSHAIMARHLNLRDVACKYGGSDAVYNTALLGLRSSGRLPEYIEAFYTKGSSKCYLRQPAVSRTIRVATSERALWLASSTTLLNIRLDHICWQAKRKAISITIILLLPCTSHQFKIHLRTWPLAINKTKGKQGEGEGVSAAQVTGRSRERAVVRNAAGAGCEARGRCAAAYGSVRSWCACSLPSGGVKLKLPKWASKG
eukprot:IDg10700t1